MSLVNRPDDESWTRLHGAPRVHGALNPKGFAASRRSIGVGHDPDRPFGKVYLVAGAVLFMAAGWRSYRGEPGFIERDKQMIVALIVSYVKVEYKFEVGQSRWRRQGHTGAYGRQNLPGSERGQHAAPM